MNRRAPVERIVLAVPGVGRVVVLRQVHRYGGRSGPVAREASASRLGVFEYNYNSGGRGWHEVPLASVATRPRFHVRSDLRRQVLAEHARLVREG